MIDYNYENYILQGERCQLARGLEAILLANEMDNIANIRATLEFSCWLRELYLTKNGTQTHRDRAAQTPTCTSIPGWEYLPPSTLPNHLQMLPLQMI